MQFTALGSKNGVESNPTPMLAANMHEFSRRCEGRTISHLIAGGGPGHEEVMLCFEDGTAMRVQARESEESFKPFRFGAEFLAPSTESERRALVLRRRIEKLEEAKDEAANKCATFASAAYHHGEDASPHRMDQTYGELRDHHATRNARLVEIIDELRFRVSKLEDSNASE